MTMTKKAGRKVTQSDDPRVERLIEALNAGNYLEHACDYAGIGKSTVYRWLDRGQNEAERIDAGNEPNPDEHTYLELWDAIKKARASAMVRNVAIIQQAARGGTWQAAAWWLERTAPQQYGRRLSAEVTGAEGGAINVSVTVDALESKIAALLGDVVIAEEVIEVENDAIHSEVTDSTE
jgi:hypothetical protein